MEARRNVNNNNKFIDKSMLQVVEVEKISSDGSGSTEVSIGGISMLASGSSTETLAALMKADRRVIVVNEARKAAYSDPIMKPITASVVLQILSYRSMAVRECVPPCKAKIHGSTMLPLSHERIQNEAEDDENAAMELPLIASVFRSL